MTITQDAQFTVSEFRSAIEVAKLGHADDVPEPLRDFIREIVREFDYIYRITGADLDAYLSECPDLDDYQREFFKGRAREYIESTGTFGESLQVCLDFAFTDALGTSG